MKISAVIVAAGGSTRMRSGGASKLMMAVGGEPVLRRTLRAFDAAACISEIVVVAREVDFEDVRRAAEACERRCASRRAGASGRIPLRTAFCSAAGRILSRCTTVRGRL